MRYHKSRIILMIFILLMLAACGNDETSKNTEVDQEALDNVNEEGMPIVKDSITLDFFAAKPPITADDWGDVMVWKEYEKKSNIKVNWETIPTASVNEKRNLKLASGDLPDVFYSSWISVEDLFKYGEQGVFLSLNELIDQYAPNLKKIFEEHPEVKKAVTLPDGNIYSFPTVQGFQSMRFSTKPFINGDWLDALEMEIPETTEEFYQYLKAVKEQDPNGNGEADEIPYGAQNMDQLITWIRGSFGIGQGKQSGNVDLDPQEKKIRFYPITDEYKEMLQYVNKLYSEGLIEQNIFSIEQEQYLANGSEGLYGSTNWHNPVGTFGKEGGKAFEGMPALEGPSGYQLFTSVNHPAASLTSFAITSENENPVATVRWIDHFYGDEGAKLLFMGIEGETFKENDEGELEYVDEITNNPDGLTLDQAIAQYLTWPGGSYAGIAKEKYFKGSESSYQELEATEKLEPYVIEEVWPSFTYTAEENDKLSGFGSDIDKYVGEMRDKFISGDASFSEWNKYVETLESMNLEEYMNIKEDAYERYKNN